MSWLRVSADSDRFGFVTYFHASFDVSMCHFALLMLRFVIAVRDSDFLLWIITVITQWSLLEGLSVTFQDMMDCKEGHVFERSTADVEVAHVLVCLPSFKIFSCFILNFET